MYIILYSVWLKHIIIIPSTVTQGSVQVAQIKIKNFKSLKLYVFLSKKNLSALHDMWNTLLYL